MRFHKFTEEDLTSNKRGSLTTRQREFLKKLGEVNRETPDTTIAGIILILYFGVLVFLWARILNEEIRKALLSNPVILLVVVVVLVVLPYNPILVFGMRLAPKKKRKVANIFENAQLKVAEGIVRHIAQKNPENDILGYDVYVGKEHFQFEESMKHIFEEGVKYRVYFCEAGRQWAIMSFEQIEDQQGSITNR